LSKSCLIVAVAGKGSYPLKISYGKRGDVGKAPYFTMVHELVDNISEHSKAENSLPTLHRRKFFRDHL
jgi:hypothetical protein